MGGLDIVSRLSGPRWGDFCSSSASHVCLSPGAGSSGGVGAQPGDERNADQVVLGRAPKKFRLRRHVVPSLHSMGPGGRMGAHGGTSSLHLMPGHHHQRRGSGASLTDSTPSWGPPGISTSSAHDHDLQDDMIVPGGVDHHPVHHHGDADHDQLGGTVPHAKASDPDQPNMVAPFVATGGDLSKIITVLREGRCTLDSYMAILYFYFLWAFVWIGLGKVYTQSQLSWLKNEQFYTTDGVLLIIIPATFCNAGPSSFLHRAVPNTQLIGWRALLLLCSLWMTSNAFFYSMVGLGRGLSAEPTNPTLNIRRVDDPLPAWWTSLDMFKDDILFLGDMQARSDGMEASLVYVVCVMHMVLVALALAFGGRSSEMPARVQEQLRQEAAGSAGGGNVGGVAEGGGGGVEVGSGEGSSCSGSPRHQTGPRRHGDMEHGVADRDESGAPAPTSFVDLRTGRGVAPFLGYPPSCSEVDEPQPPGPVGSAIEQDEEEDIATTLSSPRKPLTNVTTLAEHETNTSFPVKWLTNPCKNWFWHNYLFVACLLFFLCHVIILVASHSSVWNRVFGVNATAYPNADFRTYFTGFHGTSRQMRNLESLEIQALTKGDAKKKLVLPIKAQFGPELTAHGNATASSALQPVPKRLAGADTGECKTFAQLVLQHNEAEKNLKSAHHDRAGLLDGREVAEHVFLPLKNSASEYRQVGEGTCGLKFTKNRHSKANLAAEKQKDSVARDHNLAGDLKQLMTTEQPHSGMQDLGLLG